MAVQPIDIQVNFSQLNTVSAEQSMSKQAVLAAEADSTRHMIRESLKQAEKVKKIENGMIGVAAIHDGEEEPSAKSWDNRTIDETLLRQSKKEHPVVFVDDPDKGHEIDLMC